MRVYISTLNSQQFEHLKHLYEDFKHHSARLPTHNTIDLIDVFERFEHSFLNLKYQIKTLLKKTSKYSIECDNLRNSLLALFKNIQNLREIKKKAVEKQLPLKFTSKTISPINAATKERLRVLQMEKSLELTKCLLKSPYQQSQYQKKREAALASLMNKNKKLLAIAQRIGMNSRDVKILKVNQKKTIKKFEAETQEKLVYLSTLEKDTCITIKHELKILDRALKDKFATAKEINANLARYQYPALVNHYTICTENRLRLLARTTSRLPTNNKPLRRFQRLLR